MEKQRLVAKTLATRYVCLRTSFTSKFLRKEVFMMSFIFVTLILNVEGRRGGESGPRQLHPTSPTQLASPSQIRAARRQVFLSAELALNLSRGTTRATKRPFCLSWADKPAGRRGSRSRPSSPRPPPISAAAPWLSFLSLETHHLLPSATP